VLMRMRMKKPVVTSWRSNPSLLFGAEG
jgi:hypothetical protein